jgi:NADH-quinone oxidoreductase subunit C
VDVNQITSILNETCPGVVKSEHLEEASPWLEIGREGLPSICRALRDDQRLACNQLMCLSGVHTADGELWSVLHVFSSTHRHKLGLKVVLHVDDPHCPSVADIWPTADWHEREAYDMVGIVYDGHPDLRRILCPDDWEGHPLRKDYQAPTTYNGMQLD